MDYEYEFNTRIENIDGEDHTWTTCRVLEHPAQIYVEAPSIYDGEGNIDTAASQASAQGSADEIIEDLAEE
jgi:hypothetical protein